MTELQLNPKNPRIMSAVALDRLAESIRDFPKMMALRPIVVDKKNMVLGGNQRLLAINHLGMVEVPDEWVKQAGNLTKAEQQRFIVQDNLQAGDWEYELLTHGWDMELLEAWGIDIPDMSIEIEDIEGVEGFNEGVDFLIKCANISELEELQKKLEVTGRRLNYHDFLSKTGLWKLQLLTLKALTGAA